MTRHGGWSGAISFSFPEEELPPKDKIIVIDWCEKLDRAYIPTYPHQPPAGTLFWADEYKGERQ